MTDGILLAEIQQDRLMMQYDVDHDDARERSPEYRLYSRLPARTAAEAPGSQVIITSATIDPQRFSRHFNNAPIIEGFRPHLPGGGALPPGGGRRR